MMTSNERREKELSLCSMDDESTPVEGTMPPYTPGKTDPGSPTEPASSAGEDDRTGDGGQQGGQTSATPNESNTSASLSPDAQDDGGGEAVPLGSADLVIQHQQDQAGLSNARTSAPVQLLAVVPEPMSLLRSLSRGSSQHLYQHKGHHHHHNSSIRMEDVGFLMREQDADLLESIHRNGPNQTGMTPVLSSSQHRLFAENNDSEQLHESIPPLSLAGEEEEGGGGIVVTLPVVVSRSPVAPSRQIFDAAETETTKGDEDKPLPTTPGSPERLQERPSTTTVCPPNSELIMSSQEALTPRALSGDIVLRGDSGSVNGSKEVVDSSSHHPDNRSESMERRSFLREDSVNGSKDVVSQYPDDENEQVLHRSESEERRMNEAAQFAEAVGELPLTEQEDFRIIDEVNENGDDADTDDDDDDDATEVRVERSRMLRPSKSIRTIHAPAPAAPISLDALPSSKEADKSSSHGGSRPPLLVEPHSSRTAISGTSSQQPPPPPFISQESPVKPRPESASPARGAAFLAQLPSSASTQDFVYKGIHSNPPEIIKRGTTRGNYAQLHRKAWLEVSDKYHRYGKHLRLYYRYWERLGCPTNMFFDWLDSKGEAAGLPLPELEDCPRSKLDSDTVLYISNPDVTQNYALQLQLEDTVIADDRGNKQVMRRGRVLDVDGDPVKTGPDGWIFVLRDNVMYGNQKITSVLGHSKQRFHHSSFFGGKAVAAAGIFITDEEGFLTRLYPHSGHYRPGEAHVQRCLFFLFHEGIDLNTIEMDTQQIQHVSRDGGAAATKDKETDKENGDEATKEDKEVKTEKKKKIESLHLMPAVLVACFLAHKARFIGEGIFAQIHQIRKAEVTSVTEALLVIDNGGVWRRKQKVEPVAE